ncbi:ribonuclease H1 isoform X2 [Pyrgilauda ruficollis]|uniref:ribonuclease H1 isoform X2 n=1 Tax=Pyrgilauda ruficollis TaxID=221976 RepID=UPI001B873150|nr:ribonuclease H1 isoform X2 [Pyrgilauda ruficollis]
MLRWFLAVLSHSCFVPRGGSMFYAVRKGRRTGVYRTWAECQEQVNKFPSASFKKFATEKDAWTFVRAGVPGPQQPEAAEAFGPPAVTQENGSQREEPDLNTMCCSTCKRPYEQSTNEEQIAKRVKHDELHSVCSIPTVNGDKFSYMGDFAVVYTDGCCSGNGRNRARAGIGVYWGPGHPFHYTPF